MVIKAATVREGPSDEAEPLCELKSGDPFSMLDNRLGWAWGYAGNKRLVGYVRSTDIGLPK